MRASSRLWILLVIAIPSVAHPQAIVRAPGQSLADYETKSLDIWGAYSDGSVPIRGYNTVRGMRLGLAALRWSRILGPARKLRFDQGVDLIPVARTSPSSSAGTAGDPNSADASLRRSFPPGSSRGFGINPVVLGASYRPVPRVQWRAGVTGGLLLFNQPVPTTASRSVAYASAVEAGMQMVGWEGDGLSVTYRFHQLWDAGPARYPVMSHMVSVGLHFAMAYRP